MEILIPLVRCSPLSVFLSTSLDGKSKTKNVWCSEQKSSWTSNCGLWRDKAKVLPHSVVGSSSACFLFPLLHHLNLHRCWGSVSSKILIGKINISDEWDNTSQLEESAVSAHCFEAWCLQILIILLVCALLREVSFQVFVCAPTKNEYAIAQCFFFRACIFCCLVFVPFGSTESPKSRTCLRMKSACYLTVLHMCRHDAAAIRNPHERNVLDPGQGPEQAQGRLFVKHLVVELELLERRALVRNLF